MAVVFKRDSRDRRNRLERCGAGAKAIGAGRCRPCAGAQRQRRQRGKGRRALPIAWRRGCRRRHEPAGDAGVGAEGNRPRDAHLLLDSDHERSPVVIHRCRSAGGCAFRGEALRNNPRRQLTVQVRSDARRDRAASRGVGYGLHTSARRRVHALVLPAGPVDRQQRRAAIADGRRADRLDRHRRHR